jgi:hypothetical protein
MCNEVHASSVEQFCSDRDCSIRLPCSCEWFMVALLEAQGDRNIETSPTETRRHEEIVMAKVIEFYVPTNFHTPLKGKSGRRAKVIEICTQANKSA